MMAVRRRGAASLTEEESNTSQLTAPAPAESTAPAPAPKTIINHQNVLVYVTLGVLVLGSGLTAFSLQRVRSLTSQRCFETWQVRYPQRPLAWVHPGKAAWNGDHLRHVVDMLERVGYGVSMGNIEPKNWKLYWSHDYPFSSNNMRRKIGSLKPFQRINKFPGTGFITQKRYLSLSKVSFLPKAFSLPKDEAAFKALVTDKPQMMWVKKNDNHRGIKVVTSQEAIESLTDNKGFVQEYIQNPLLIDKRKFDIGVYAVITNIDPIRVYIFENDLLIRFCAEDYYPFDAANIKKYVVGDDYSHPYDLPSLKNYLVQGKYSYKEALKSYMKLNNLDFDKVMNDIRSAITEVYLSQQQSINKIFMEKNLKNNYFELVRFDFILDEQLRLVLMEANMSPNLSSGHFSQNYKLYEQVIMNTLAVAGMATYDGARPHYGENHIQHAEVGFHDLLVKPITCANEPCASSCANASCVLCESCFDDDWVNVLQNSYFEHMNRRHMRRLLPTPLLSQNAAINWPNNGTFGYDDLAPTDKKLFLWYRQKCIENTDWCS